MSTKSALEINPFVQALVINGYWRTKTTELGPQEESGRGIEIRADLIDADERCAVFTDHLLGWFSALAGSAKDMFMYVAHKLPYEKDYFELIEEKYCEDMKISRRTFHTAKTELTNRLLIPRTSRRNTYWVNPSYLFKGDRVKHFRAQVRERNVKPTLKSNEEG